MRAATSTLRPNNLDKDLSDYKLNCLWVHARITNIEDLANALITTKSVHNQTWLLFVYEQMPLDSDVSLDYRLEVINRFLNRDDLTDKAVSIANKMISRLNSPNKAN